MTTNEEWQLRIEQAVSAIDERTIGMKDDLSEVMRVLWRGNGASFLTRLTVVEGVAERQMEECDVCKKTVIAEIQSRKTANRSPDVSLQQTTIKAKWDYRQARTTALIVGCTSLLTAVVVHLLGLIH
jgi:hypothetical protein